MVSYWEVCRVCSGVGTVWRDLEAERARETRRREEDLEQLKANLRLIFSWRGMTLGLTWSLGYALAVSLLRQEITWHQAVGLQIDVVAQAYGLGFKHVPALVPENGNLLVAMAIAGVGGAALASPVYAMFRVIPMASWREAGHVLRSRRGLALLPLWLLGYLAPSPLLFPGTCENLYDYARLTTAGYWNLFQGWPIETSMVVLASCMSGNTLCLPVFAYHHRRSMQRR